MQEKYSYIKPRIWENIQRMWYKFSRNILSIVGLILVCVIIFIAIFASYIAPFPESAGSYVKFDEASQPPSIKHPCGTDINGRDILTRIFFGFRISLLIAVMVLSIGSFIGVTLGIVAGYFQGTLLDHIIMRFTDVMISIPALILALSLCAILGPNIFNAMLAITAVWWTFYTRMLYGTVVSIKNANYIIAAELNGASSLHIIFKEILPNCIGQILTKISLDVGWVMMVAASMSYVGLGIQPPTPDLGNMVAEGTSFLPAQWWISVFPSIAILLTVLGFNLLGDGIRDMLVSEER